MEQYELQAQNEFLAIDKQYKQLLARGKELLQKMWEVFRTPPLDSAINVSSPGDGLSFYIFGQEFQVFAEFAFANDGRITEAFLNAYFRDSSITFGSDERQLICSVNFDKIGNIDNRYTLDDFVQPYLFKTVAAYRTHVIKRHAEEKYTIILKEK